MRVHGCGLRITQEHLPVFDKKLQPLHQRGIVADIPSLYFVGLFILHAMWSETITGVPPDVRHVVDHLVEHRPRQSV